MGNRKYKQAHRDLGLCIDCSKPVYPDRIRCLTHIRGQAKIERLRRKRLAETYLRYEQDRKELRRQQGLCPSCGAPADDGYIMCCNCRDRLYFERVENATPIV